MLHIIKILSKQTKLFAFALSLLLVLVIGVIDYVAGENISLLVFFMLPIFVAVWFVGKKAGIAVSILSGAVWTAIAMTSTHVYAHPVIPYGNIVTKFAFLLIFAHILAPLKDVLESERELARTDHLTGVANRRYFFEVADMEIKRARRHARPFSVAYMDMDEFKSINDRFGHSVGDGLLQTLAATIKTNVRDIDIVARLGGDEFAILMPETDGESAQLVVERIQESLTRVNVENSWTITFSIGVATWAAPPKTVDDMLKNADIVMYSAKSSGKNRIQYEVFGEQSTAA
jgi:diguanylate cyclase (GGDEF)-like protein